MDHELVRRAHIVDDPLTGTFKPLVTTGDYARPVIRPLPTAP